MEAATENLVLSQVQRELDAETHYQNRKLAMSDPPRVRFADRVFVGRLPHQAEVVEEIEKIRSLGQQVPREITGKPRMSITGSTHLAASIKDKISAAKARALKATEGSDVALAKFNSAMDQAEAVNKSIEAEADDLVAQLGQFTNGGPV